jgi:ankyrin repeat protein
MICASCQVSEISEIPIENLRSLIKGRNSASQSALHLAAANGHLNIVEFLIKYLHPIDVNLQIDEGSTPLHWAALNGHLAIVEKLLEAGADATVTNASGRSPVTLAEQQSHLEVVQVLLKSYDPEEDDETVDTVDANGVCVDLENE